MATNLRWLEQAIFRRRLISWNTMSLRYAPDWMYPEFFATFVAIEVPLAA